MSGVGVCGSEAMGAENGRGTRGRAGRRGQAVVNARTDVRVLRVDAVCRCVHGAPVGPRRVAPWHCCAHGARASPPSVASCRHAHSPRHRRHKTQHANGGRPHRTRTGNSPVSDSRTALKSAPVPSISMSGYLFLPHFTVTVLLMVAGRPGRVHVRLQPRVKEVSCSSVFSSRPVCRRPERPLNLTNSRFCRHRRDRQWLSNAAASSVKGRGVPGAAPTTRAPAADTIASERLWLPWKRRRCCLAVPHCHYV